LLVIYLTEQYIAEIRSDKIYFDYKNGKFVLDLTINKTGLLIKISKPLFIDYWENCYNVNEQQRMNNSWNYFDNNEDFKEFILSSIKLKQFEIENINENIQLKLWIIIDRISSKIKQEINLILFIVHSDIKSFISDLAYNLQITKNKNEILEQELSLEKENRISAENSLLEEISAYRNQTEIIINQLKEELLNLNNKYKELEISSELKFLKKDFDAYILMNTYKSIRIKDMDSNRCLQYNQDNTFIMNECNNSEEQKVEISARDGELCIFGKDNQKERRLFSTFENDFILKGYKYPLICQAQAWKIIKQNNGYYMFFGRLFDYLDKVCLEINDITNYIQKGNCSIENKNQMFSIELI
jgi:hypothetical protein